MAYLVSEARKFALHLVLANQNLSQIAVNKGSMLFFRMGVKDAEKLEAYTSPELLSHDLQNMPDYHAAARLLSNNVPVRPFVFRTLPDSGNREWKCATGHAADIINASREKYVKTAEQVEGEILLRRYTHKHKTSSK